MQVWLAAYRHYPSLATADVPAPQALKLAPDLDLPACSNPAMASAVRAYKPCDAISRVSQRTSLTTDAYGATVHSVSLDVRARIHPGLSGLRDMDGGCQYTHLFGLASMTADFHLLAEDVGPTNAALDVACASTPANLDTGSGVWFKTCGCGPHCGRTLLVKAVQGISRNVALVPP